MIEEDEYSACDQGHGCRYGSCNFPREVREGDNILADTLWLGLNVSPGRFPPHWQHSFEVPYAIFSDIWRMEILNMLLYMKHWPVCPTIPS